jgi:DNA-binding NarL/FixJ family response regulator
MNASEHATFGFDGEAAPVAEPWPMTPIRIVVADDHPLLRAGIQAILDDQSDFQIIAGAADGREAMGLIESHRPDVALVDISMPGMSGIDLTQLIARAESDTRVIILSMHKDEAYVTRAFRAGASGYLLKDSDTEELGLAIRAVARGGIYLSPEVSRFLVDDYRRQVNGQATPENTLSPRQTEVLQLLANGVTTKAMARRLGISAKTVQTHRAQLMERLGIHDVAKLVKYAIRIGLISADSD